MDTGKSVRPPCPLFLIILLLFLLSSCHVARYVYWNFADIHDNEKFPVIPIQASHRPSGFLKGSDTLALSLPDGYPCSDGNPDFEHFLAAHKTVAFLVIRHDSLIYEHYFKGYSRTSILPSFSIAKSFVSALIGIAIAEGKIHSIDQPVTDFLPELADTGFRRVTLRDLLEMRSGIRFTEGYASPFGGMAKFYYGLNLKRYTLSLKTADAPGLAYNYQSANTQLLAMALERATGKSMAVYMEEKIWRPMGSIYPASWSTDSKFNREPKAFCCINASAIDFARFGQLMLDQGKRGDDTIIPPGWVRESLTIHNDSHDSQGFPYTYHWRVTDRGDFFAKGILGQYIYVCPAKKIVIVRFGSKSGDLVWARFFSDLVKNL